MGWVVVGGGWVGGWVGCPSPSPSPSAQRASSSKAGSPIMRSASSRHRYLHRSRENLLGREGGLG